MSSPPSSESEASRTIQHSGDDFELINSQGQNHETSTNRISGDVVLITARCDEAMSCTSTDRSLRDLAHSPLHQVSTTGQAGSAHLRDNTMSESQPGNIGHSSLRNNEKWVSSASLWIANLTSAENTVVEDEQLTSGIERPPGQQLAALSIGVMFPRNIPDHDAHRETALPYRTNKSVEENVTGIIPTSDLSSGGVTEQQKEIERTYVSSNSTPYNNPSEIAAAVTDGARQEKKVSMQQRSCRRRQIGRAGSDTSLRDDYHPESSIVAAGDLASIVSDTEYLQQGREKCILSITRPSTVTRASTSSASVCSQQASDDPYDDSATSRSTRFTTTDDGVPCLREVTSSDGVTQSAVFDGGAEKAMHSSMLFSASNTDPSRVLGGIVDPVVSVQNQAIGSSTPTPNQSHVSSHGTGQRRGRLPGAFPIPGRNARNTHTLEATSDSPRPVMEDSGSRPSTRRDSSRLLVSAILVDDDIENHGLDFARREEELAEQERRLAERAAQLQHWQEELERQQRELSTSQGKIVQAEIVPVTPSPLTFPSSAFRMPTLLGGGKILGVATGDQKIPALKSDDYEDFSEALTMDPIHEKFDLRDMNLGAGPLRFAPVGERSLEEQIMSLSRTDRRCYKNLKQRWDDKKAKNRVNFDFPKEMILRFARNNQKAGQFLEERAWKAMKKFQNRFMYLSAHAMERQLLTKTLFPVPGLKSMEGHDMFYMRPARYFPSETPAKTIIDNLAYVMNTMMENERPCTDGIGFLACMNDWTMRNFEVNYCFKFMMTLQSYVVPVQVQLFLIVNPPSWFGAIWRIMKPMLAPSFRKKVKMIPESKLHKYLQHGFEAFLPDDLSTGQAGVDEIVADFVTYRKSVENCMKTVGLSSDCDSHADSSIVSDHQFGFDVPSQSSSRKDLSGSDLTFSDGRVSHRWRNSDDSSSDYPRSDGFGSHRSLDSRSLNLSHSNADDDEASIHCDIDDDLSILTSENMGAAQTILEET